MIVCYHCAKPIKGTAKTVVPGIATTATRAAVL